MRRVSVKVARFVALAVASTTAAGLVAALPPASQAAAGHSVARHHATAARVPTVRAPAGPDRLALARLMAAQAQRRGRSFPVAPAGAASAAQFSAHARTGIITGLVRSAAGGPLGAACVSATGPAGSATARSRANGRYLLTGLRPGRYQVRVGMCANPGRPVTGSPVISLWPGLPATITVRAGQMVTLTPATLEHVGQLRRPLPFSATANTKTGSISGLVTGNGKPLRGLCVVAFPNSGGFIGLAITSKTGKYRMTRLRPGVYQVEFASFGCGSDPGNWLQQWYRGINSLFPTGKAANLRVRAGKNIPGINGKLKAGGEIAGTVRSKSGKKLSGICVDFTGVFKDGTFGIGLATNKTGFFALHGLFPAKYTIEFTIGCGTKGNYAFQWWRGATTESRATIIKITGRTIDKNIDPVLAPGATIKGRVTGRSAAGPPLLAVCVNAFGSDGNADAFGFTASNGRYQLQGLASGRYTIDFDPSCGPPATASYLVKDRSASVKAGQTLSGFNVFLAPGATISGKVTDSHGNALGSVCVAIGDPNEDITQTNPGGTYSVVGIQPGAYLVAFFGGCGNKVSVAPQFYNNQPTVQTANPVKFVGGTTTANIDAQMQPGGTIAGVVTDLAGHQLNDLCVGASPIGAFPEEFADVEFTGHGRYRMDNLEPGRYLLQFNCATQNFGTQWFNGQPDSTSADLLSVNAGVVTAASARLSVGGRIAGTVTNAAGHTLSNICVSVFNARDFAPINVLSSLIPALNGRYTISGLNPGRYLVNFSDCNGRLRYGAQWYRGKTTITSATPVTIRAGRTTAGINARLAVGGSISGLVTGPGNRPLRGICVQAIDALADSFGFATTDKRGHYTVPALASGRYSTFFTPCAGGLPNLGSLTRPGLVTVTAPHAVTGVDIKLAPGGSISGTVTSSVAPVSGLGGVCVLLLPANPNGSLGAALTSQNGHYVVRDLAPGTYEAIFDDPFCDFVNEGLGPFAPQWFNGQPTQATANDITVKAGNTTTGITAALQNYGSITGTVTNAAHTGVSGECVTAVPVGGAADPFSGEPAAPEIAESTSGGHYTLTDLAAGRYKVKFSVGCGDAGFATQWWDNTNSENMASVITVAFTAIGGIDATLSRQ